MELSQDKKDALQAFLSRLGEAHLVTLVSAMDYARAQGANDIPYELIMSFVRPTLFELRPPRSSNAQRIFCDPFEDLLVPSDPEIKTTTVIARASIQPIWDWLVKRGGTTFETAGKTLNRALKSKDEEEIWDAKCYIWQTAVGLMEGPLEDAAESAEAGQALSVALGGTNRLEDMEEMLHVLQVASELEALKKKLPVKPITRLSPANITAIKDCYESTSETHPGEESWIIVAAMRRLLKQAEILKVVNGLSREGGDTLLAVTDLAKVGNVVIGSVEEIVQVIDDMASTGGSEEALLGLIREYVSGFTAITSNLEIKRDGEWGKRLFESRKIVSSALERTIISQAPKKLAAALKQRDVKAGRTKRKISDLRADLDQDNYRVARAAAQSMQESLRLADKIGLNAKAQSVANEMVGQLEKFSDQLLEDVHTVPDEYKERAKQHVIMVAHLMEFLVDSEQADLFLRRAMRRITGDSEETV